MNLLKILEQKKTKNYIKLFVFAAIMIASTNVNAQISVSANLGLLSNTAAESEGTLGLNLEVKYDISDALRVGASAGYYSKSDELNGIKVSSNTMPICGLVEYSFSDGKVSPYAGANFGLYSFGARVDGVSVSSGYFGLAPVVGANYSLSDNLAINANAKYHYVMTEGEASSLYSINVGVSFFL
jgi:outer membrane protein W